MMILPVRQIHLPLIEEGVFFVGPLDKGAVLRTIALDRYLYALRLLVWLILGALLCVQSHWLAVCTHSDYWFG